MLYYVDQWHIILSINVVSGEAVMFDATSIYEVYYKTLSMGYKNTALAFDTMFFVLENLEKLCYNTSLLSKYFPNLLKVRLQFVLVFFT